MCQDRAWSVSGRVFGEEEGLSGLWDPVAIAIEMNQHSNWESL